MLTMLSFSCNKKNESFSGNEKDEIEFESKGIISGIDSNLCQCCRGYIIEIDGDINDYRIGDLPDEFQINIDEIPISVKLNWDIQSTCESIGISYIEVESIEIE